MSCIIEISLEAAGDLAAIADFLGQAHDLAGLLFFEELETSIYGIADFPERFPLVPRYRSLGIRRRVCGAYIIFYVLTDERISIVRVLHGAQDYEKMLIDNAENG